MAFSFGLSRSSTGLYVLLICDKSLIEVSDAQVGIFRTQVMRVYHKFYRPIKYLGRYSICSLPEYLLISSPLLLGIHVLISRKVDLTWWEAHSGI